MIFSEQQQTTYSSVRSGTNHLPIFCARGPLQGAMLRLCLITKEQLWFWLRYCDVTALIDSRLADNYPERWRRIDWILVKKKKKKVWSLSSVCTEMWASAVTRDIKQFTWWIWAIRAFARGRGDGAAWLVAGLFDSSSPASDIRGEIVWRCSKDLQGQTLRC